MMDQRGYTPANVTIVVLVFGALFFFFYAFSWMLQQIGQEQQLLDVIQLNPLLSLVAICFFVMLVIIMLFGIMEGD